MESRENRATRIMLSEPSYGLIDFRAHDNRLDFYMHLARNERDEEGNKKFEFFTGNMGRYVVHMQREDMAYAALETGMDYILFIDDDMMVPPDTLFRLLAHEKPIVGALAYRRRGTTNLDERRWTSG